MNLRPIAIGALLGLVVASCATTSPPARNDAISLPGDFKRLNSGSVPARVGEIYVVRRTSVTELFDVLGARSIGDDAGWITASQKNSIQEVSLGRMNQLQGRGICTSRSNVASALREIFCPPPISIDVTLEVSDVHIDRLVEPFAILEILNRPSSGLIYNREADARIMQLRASLAEAIAEYPALANEKVAVCTEVQLALHSQIRVRGKIPTEQALTIARDFASRLALEIDEAAQSSAVANGEPIVGVTIKGTLTISAQFRTVGLVDVSTSPRIDYRLGGVQNIDIRSP